MPASPTHQGSPENSRAAARELVLIYDALVNRNPDPEGFTNFLRMIEEGMPTAEVFRIIAGSDEAASKFLSNPNLDGLRNKLLPGLLTASPRDPVAWKAEARPAVVHHQLKIFQVELTNRCPFRCVMCPRTHHMTREQGNMEVSLFRSVIDQLVAMNPRYGEMEEPIWLHHFGESLTYPHLAECIRYARSRGIGTRMSINPLMLSEKVMSDLFDAEPVMLLVCLDGRDDDSFEKIRGLPHAYEKSQANLLEFLRRKVERNSRIRVEMSVVDFALNGNRDDPGRQEVEAFWRTQPGVDGFLWKPFTTWNGDASEIVSLRSLTTADATVQAHRDAFKVTCDWPWRKMVVTWTGDLVPCCHDYNAKYALGNLASQSLQEIWNGEKMQALRREFASGTVTNPLCASCEYLRR